MKRRHTARQGRLAVASVLALMLLLSTGCFLFETYSGPAITSEELCQMIQDETDCTAPVAKCKTVYCGEPACFSHCGQECGDPAVVATTEDLAKVFGSAYENDRNLSCSADECSDTGVPDYIFAYCYRPTHAQ